MRCRECSTEDQHQEFHQKTTTLRFNTKSGGWSKSVKRHRDGRFHCLCGLFQSRKPDEIRNHAATCCDVPESLQPSSRRSQRIARRSAAAPYPPRTPSPQRTQAGHPPAEASSTGSSHQQRQQHAGSPPAQTSGTVSSQQPIRPPPLPQEPAETSEPVSSQPQPQQEERSSSAEASGSSTTLHTPIPLRQQQQEEASSYDGDVELSSHGSFDTAYEGEAVPTPPLHTPPPQAPPLTEEAQAEVARIREMLVELITSDYRRVEDLPEEDVMITFDVRLEGLRTPALRGTLDVTRHGANVDTLARMIYGIVDGVPGGILQNLRIRYYPSHCLII